MKQGRRINRIYLGAISAVLVVSSVTFGVTSFLKTQNANAIYYSSAYCVSDRCKAAQAAEAEARVLQNEAAAERGTYQAEVNRYAANIASIQATIDRTEEEIAELNIQITNTEKKIATLKESIRQTLTKLYLNSEITELELLASASSLSDYHAATTKNSIVNNKLKQMTSDAKTAKEELEEQKAQLEIKQENNKTQKADAVALQAEQQAFVNEWAGRESSYTAAADAAAAIVEEESRIQYEENIRNWIGVSGSGGLNTYPHAWKCPGGYGYAGGDTWGNGYLCQCTSYAGWKAYEFSRGHLAYPSGVSRTARAWGNADNWANSAIAYDFYVSTVPRAQTIGVDTYGTYGHVWWVESVSDGVVYISEYNYEYKQNFGTRSYTIAQSEARGFRYIYP